LRIYEREEPLRVEEWKEPLRVKEREEPLRVEEWKEPLRVEVTFQWPLLSSFSSHGAATILST
jgi:hypothetical protein